MAEPLDIFPVSVTKSTRAPAAVPDPVGVTKFDILAVAPVDNTLDRSRYISASDGRPRERADAIITMTGPIVVGVALSCAVGYAAGVTQGVSPSYPSTAPELTAFSRFLLEPQPNPTQPRFT